MLVFNGALRRPDEENITSLTQQSQIEAPLLENTGARKAFVCATDAVRSVNSMCACSEVLRAAKVFL